MLVTIHISLAEAITVADFEANLAAIRLAHEGAQRFGVAAPRVAVAGLNPHAGEGGLFGREEIEIIRPAIEAAAGGRDRRLRPLAWGHCVHAGARRAV